MKTYTCKWPIPRQICWGCYLEKSAFEKTAPMPGITKKVLGRITVLQRYTESKFIWRRTTYTCHNAPWRSWDIATSNIIYLQMFSRSQVKFCCLLTRWTWCATRYCAVSLNWASETVMGSVGKFKNFLEFLHTLENFSVALLSAALLVRTKYKENCVVNTAPYITTLQADKHALAEGHLHKNNI